MEIKDIYSTENDKKEKKSRELEEDDDLDKGLEEL